MPTIADIRQKYPQYQDMSDDQLADALHKKFYSDMPREEFNAKIGLSGVDPMRSQAEEMANRLEQVQGQGGAGGLFRNAFSLGLEDKMSGVMEGGAELLRGGSFGEGYKRGSLAQQILEDRARERSGNAGKAAEIAGTIATGTLARAPQALGALGRLVQTGKEAGTLGLIQGAGDSTKTSVGGVAGDALVSGGLSAGLGAGLQGGVELARPLVKGVIAGKRGLTDAMRSPTNKAAMKVTGTLADDGLTPGRVASRMERGGGPMIGNANEQTMRLGEAVSNRPGQGSQILNKSLNAQQRASADRAVSAVNDALGGGNQTFNARLGQMISARGQRGSQVYNRAFTQNFDNAPSQSQMVFKELQNRIPPEAVRNAQRVAKAEGRPFGEQLIASIDDASGTVKFSREPSLREWHYIQRGLRSAMDSAYRTGVGEVGTAYKGLHKQLLRAMDAANPTYKMARKSYATESQMIDALNQGREMMKPNTLRNIDEFADTFSSMSSGEREMVRTGLARGIEDLIQSTPDAAGNVVNKILGTPQKREAIKSVFENDTSFRQFQSRMMRMAKQAKAFKMASSQTGSPTARRMSSNSAFGAVADVGQEIVRGNVGNATIKAFGKVLSNLGGMDEATSAAVAKILVEEDPRAVMSALAAAKKSGNRRAAFDAMLTKAKQLARGAAVGIGSGMGSTISTGSQ